DGRRIGAVERATEDERAARVHLGLEGSDPFHQSVHLLGRRRCLRGLTLCGVCRQEVLTHGYSSPRCGQIPRSPGLRTGSAPEDTLRQGYPWTIRGPRSGIARTTPRPVNARGQVAEADGNRTRQAAFA